MIFMMQLYNKSLRNFTHKEKLEGMILHCIMFSYRVYTDPVRFGYQFGNGYKT